MKQNYGVFVAWAFFITAGICVRGQDVYPTDSESGQPTYAMVESIPQQIKSIIAKDPWRSIDGQTNYILEKNWVEFQGEVIEEKDDFLIFKGTFGEIGEITTGTLGTEKSVVTKATSRSDSNDKLNENYNASLNSGGNNRHATNTGARYNPINNANGITTAQYRANDQTTIQQEKRESETTVQKRLKNYGDDLYIVVNFPYPLDIKHEFEKLVAKRSGYLSYTNSHGRKVTLPKLDYGTPCDKIWSKEELETIRAQIEAPQKEALKAEMEAEEKRIKADQDKMKKDVDLAGKGDVFALRRLGDRYHNGVGVEKDLAMANKYYDRATELSEAEAEKDAKNADIKQQEALKQKFLINLELADKQDNVTSALYVEKCYRNGIGTEIDTVKADAYHAKAVSLGIPELPNRRSY
ncbi:MAG TPA: tetratricopeptide repeat protein [Verrucomicrobiae bacterium]|nr:tetratricopeptide repeat protein [Verrucomicrobiae bacterium]